MPWVVHSNILVEEIRCGGMWLKENKWRSAKDIFLGFLLLAVLGIGSVYILKISLTYIGMFIEKLNQITSNMDAVVIVALITGSVSILGVVISSTISKIIEYQQNTKRYLYEKKEESYSEFIEMVYKIQRMTREDNTYSEKDMLEDLSSFSKKLTLWGSNRVIKKWLAFRERNQNEKTNPMENLFILEEIIFEIRKDMGQRQKGLKQGDILAFFVNDINKYLPSTKKNN